jgi:hypothetical protein
LQQNTNIPCIPQLAGISSGVVNTEIEELVQHIRAIAADQMKPAKKKRGKRAKETT